MTPREILHAAADRIETVGWCKGNYAMTTEGKPCRTRCMGFLTDDIKETDALGAIRFFDNKSDGDDAKALLQGFVGQKSNLADWNDSQPNARAVANALRRAAGE